MKKAKVITFHRAIDQQASKTSNRQHNIAAIRECQRVLSQNNALCIFPEGVSHDNPQLKPLKHGAAHIALGYLEHYPKSRPLHIVPVGLYFEKKFAFKSHVFVKFGSPIQINQWVQSNPNPSTKSLTNAIKTEMEQTFVTHQSKRDSLLMHWTAQLLLTAAKAPPTLGQSKTHYQQVVKAMTLIQDTYYKYKTMPVIIDLETRIFKLRNTLRKEGIHIQELFLPMSVSQAMIFTIREGLFTLLFLPIFLIGFGTHSIMIGLTLALARYQGKRQNHWATHVVFNGVGLLVINTMLIAILTGIYLGPLIALSSLIALPLLMVMSAYYIERVNGIIHRAKTFIKLTRYPERYNPLKHTASQLLTDLSQVVEKINQNEASS